MSSSTVRDLFGSLLALACVGFALLGWRHHQQRLSDKQGAWRLSVAAIIAGLVDLFFEPIHYWRFDEVVLLFRSLSFASFTACFLFAGYSALDPLCRRRMPELLVTWKRLLCGKFRDPRVGRDILYGLGVSLSLTTSWCIISAIWPDFQVFQSVELLAGGRHIPLSLAPIRLAILAFCFVHFSVFICVATVTRSRVAAITVLVIYSGLIQGEEMQAPHSAWPLMILSFVPVVFGLSRVGLLCYLTGSFAHALLCYPITTNTEAFYFEVGLVGPTLFVVLLCYAASAACGKKFFGDFFVPS